MYHGFFILQPTEGYLVCFQVLAILNKVAISFYFKNSVIHSMILFINARHCIKVFGHTGK